MDIFKKINPEWPLRAGIGLTYVVSGYDLIRNPINWYWAIPSWLNEAIASFIGLDSYLRFQGALELFFAFVLLAWFMKKAAVKLIALLSTLEFAAILFISFFPFIQVNFLITFRDIGLLGAALALLAILSSKNDPA